MRIDSGLGAGANGAALQKWVNPVMAAGLDLLTAKGATVLYGQFPTIGEDAFRVVNEPLGLELTSLANTRRDLPLFYRGTSPGYDSLSARRVEPDAVAGILLEDLAPLRPDHQRWWRANARDRGLDGRDRRMGPPEVGSRHGSGHGVDDSDGGLRRGHRAASTGPRTARPRSSPPSAPRSRPSGPSQLEQFKPDVIFVMSSVWDLGDRQLDTWDDFKSPGDPEFDAWLLDAVRDGRRHAHRNRRQARLGTLAVHHLGQGLLPRPGHRARSRSAA